MAVPKRWVNEVEVWSAGNSQGNLYKGEPPSRTVVKNPSLVPPKVPLYVASRAVRAPPAKTTSRNVLFRTVPFEGCADIGSLYVLGEGRYKFELGCRTP